MSATDLDRLQGVHDRLIAAIAELTDSRGWQQLLAVAARLPTYSPHNVLLIAAQCPDATHVAGYRAWRQLGRQVRKGERGIAILAPINTRAPATADLPGPATVPTDPELQAPATKERILRRFRVVHVFDVAQTDGPPLPEVQARLLAGAAPPGLWAGLASQVNATGFALTRGDCAPANGVTDYLTRTVTVAAGLSDAQAVKTLAHELAHVRLHGPAHPVETDRPRAEVEAESVAYLVATAHGLDPADYTVPYVASWSGGDLEVVQASAERVLATARDILASTPPIERSEKEVRTAAVSRSARRERRPARQPATSTSSRRSLQVTR